MAKSIKPKIKKKAILKSANNSLKNSANPKPFEQESIHSEIRYFYLNQTAFAPHPRPLLKNELPKNFNMSSFKPITSSIKIKKGKPSGEDGAGTVIAILDTGVFDTHDALKGKVIAKMNYSGGKTDVDDLHGHGTHLAGIIAADPTITEKNVIGVAPATKIVSIKVTEQDSEYTSWSNIADGLEQVLHYNDNEKNVLKISAVLLSYNSYDNVETSACTAHHRIHTLIQILFEKNIPVIASAGNLYDFFGRDGVAFPAHIPNVITAGAVNAGGTSARLAKFSQRLNKSITSQRNVFVAAPGVDTYSTSIGKKNSYAYMSGSSQSAAAVAAFVLLMQQKGKQSGKLNRYYGPTAKISGCIKTHASILNVSGKDYRIADLQAFLRNI